MSSPLEETVTATDRVYTLAHVTDELGHLLDALPDAVLIVAEDGRVQHVNHHTEIMFGYALDELLGKTVEALLPERFRSVHLAHRAGYSAEPRVRPMGAGLQLFGRRRAGDEFPVEISLSPISVGGMSLVLGVVRDVTLQRLLEQQAREELAGRLAMMQDMLDELPVGVYMARGQNAELVLANRKVADIWGAAWAGGQPMADFIAASGSKVYDLQGQELPLERLATMQAARNGASIRQHQEVIRHANGSSLSVLVNAVALDPHVFPVLSDVNARPRDPIPVVLVVHQDVSALREAERVKDEFVTLAAHELRNPIASLLGYAQSLIQAVGPRGERSAHHPNDSLGPANSEDLAAPAIPREWQEEAAQAVMDASLRLAALTDDLLDATRLQANRLELRCEPLELGALLRRVVRRAQVAAGTRTIRMTAPDDPVLVEADAQRIEQVVTNLISNAVKYSPDGGDVDVILQVGTSNPNAPGAPSNDTSPFALNEQAGDEEAYSDQRPLIAQVSVRDHGIGIPADQRDRIFSRFGRAANARERGIAGTGLGLYLSRELVGLHGGHLWFESIEGHGATFNIELPRMTDIE